MKNKLILTTLVTLVIFTGNNVVYADDDFDDDSWFSSLFKSKKYSKYPYKKYMDPVNNPIYKQECGACHFAYLPELLPEQSWQKVMDNLNNHFGEDASIDTDDEKIIRTYLKNNSADKSGAKRALKFMKSLAYTKEMPIRIMEVPYMIHEHREINRKKVINDKTIGSMSNCIACHKNGEKGNFDDDSLVNNENYYKN